MKGAVQAGKWRGYCVIFLITLTDAAWRKATAVCAACKPKITHIFVHNTKTKFMGWERRVGSYSWDIHEQKSQIDWSLCLCVLHLECCASLSKQIKKGRCSS